MHMSICCQVMVSHVTVEITISSFMKGSVWSALQPINTSSSDQGKPVILTVASMDSASFFRDKSIGADSPISVSFEP